MGGGVGCRRARRERHQICILKFYFIFCNCPIKSTGPNLSTANQPVYMQDLKSLYISPPPLHPVWLVGPCPSSLLASPPDLITLRNEDGHDATKLWLPQRRRSLHSPRVIRFRKADRVRIMVSAPGNVHLLPTGTLMGTSKTQEGSTQTPIRSCKGFRSCSANTVCSLKSVISPRRLIVLPRSWVRSLPIHR